MVNNYIQGDDVVDAIGWVEQRRQELMLQKEETGAGSASNEVLILKNMDALVDAVQELLLVVKIGVAALVFLCVMAIVNK